MKKRFIIRFKREAIDKPVVYRLAKESDLILVIEIEGTDDNFSKGIEYLKNMNLNMEPIEQDINRDETKCVHCGLCTGVCTPHALYINREDMKVKFDYQKCVACELCVKVCPVRAMNVYFD